MENPNNQKEVNIDNHDKTVFNELINQGLREGGIHLTASKGFGKSRLLFSMAAELMKRDSVRTFIFDGSEAWLYGFSRIPTFNINEADIQLSEVKTIQDIETYKLTNWNLVKFALESENNLLFRLKTRKPSKRGFFIRTVINYLDSLQRNERAINANHEPKQSIAYFVEESQDAFNARSTTRLEAEEFLTVFNESRNQHEAFFTASQRLNDFSKTIRTKQAYCLGRINAEDMNPALRRLEKDLNIDLSKMPLRTWLFNGETFISPNWIQSGKPYICNREIRNRFNNYKPQPQKKAGILKQLLMLPLAVIFNGGSAPQTQPNNNEESEEETEETENSEGDGLETLEPSDILFPRDPET
ncbi:MAG: hypothetical protein ABSF65_05575 [Candidatus Bathyarchaeia archaeon]|jgi:hypothetical protein